MPDLVGNLYSNILLWEEVKLDAISLMHQFVI